MLTVTSVPSVLTLANTAVVVPTTKSRMANFLALIVASAGYSDSDGALKQ